MGYSSMSKEALSELLLTLREEYNQYLSLGLSLDMSRGKPNREQLDLTQEILGVIDTPDDCFTENGIDCRNYGLLDGIPEAKRIFADLLEIDLVSASCELFKKLGKDDAGKV